MRHIILETIHYAHICLVRDNPKDGIDEEELVDQITKKVLEKYDESKVKIDERFCCNALTEIGLCGGCKDSVKAAAEEIYFEAVKTGAVKGFEY